VILTRAELHDLLTDLERDSRRQSPATIRLRRKLSEVHECQEPDRLAEISVHLKKHTATSTKGAQ
jgi:hypothetical protein